MLNSQWVSRRRTLWAWCCVICVAVTLANAQKPDVPPPSTTTPPGDGQQPAQDTSKKSSQEKTGEAGVPDETEGAVIQSMGSGRTVDLPQVKELGGHGNWFSENVDWLHIGPVGIRSADAFYTYFTEDLSGSSSTSKLSAATFHANIAYDQRLQNTRLIWQYNPRLLEVNGHFSQQLTNQDSTLDLLFAPSSRFTFGITDWFSYYGSQNTLNDRSMERNAFSGSLMNPFLNNGAETLMNSFALPLSYNTSARTSLSIAPFLNYLRVSRAADLLTATPASTQTLFQYGARTQLNHNFSRNQSMGLFYTYQEIQERDFTQTTYYHSLGATFSRRLGRSFTLGGQFGGSRASQNGRITWTGVGSVTGTKAFRRSSLQATYGRDASFSGFLTNGYSDYAWANYSQQFGRRATATAGFGYLSGPAQGRSFRGKYAESSLSYALYRNVSWFFGYTRFWQSANAAQLNKSVQQQFQVGLRWASMRKAGL